jgi:histidinol-phosphate aminotransferase
MGAQVEHWTAQPAANFSIQPEIIAQELARCKPKVVFLCNPNNPTGHYLPPEVIGKWAVTHPQTLFVVDEAYLAFAAGACSTLTLSLANIVVLRSMTKDYALAGLRLGYLVGPGPAIIAAIAQARPAWNVNGLAQAAGLAALADQAYLQRCLVELAQASQSLVTDLRSLGLAPVPSSTHFFLLPVDDGAAFRSKLLRQGVLVRDCASFGLPTYVRIASRRPADNQRLLAAIAEIIYGA